MRFWALGWLCCWPACFGAAPNYTASSILNAASSEPGPFAPNTIVSLYGTGLSYETVSLGGAQGGYVPYRLYGSGVEVLVNSMPAGVFYVSPTQINFLISSRFLPGPARVQVVRDGVAGPAVSIQIADKSPALFQLDPEYVVAARPDGSIVTPAKAARGGEIILLYATGLGSTQPLPQDREVAREAVQIDRASDFVVTLNRVAVPAFRIEYVGLAPGFAGLYQINLRLPDALGTNPEIAIGFPERMSPGGIRLPGL